MDIFIFWEKPLFLSCGNVELLVVVCGQASGKYVMMEQVQRKINGYALGRRRNKMKICLVCSSGGHLTHLYMLRPFWEREERFWVTFPKQDAESLLEEEKMYACYYPTNRNIKALVKNAFLAWKILREERPNLIISSGAAVAVPFFYIGKLLGMKLIYIEVFDRIDKLTMTGHMVYPVADRFIVQWEELNQKYPKTINLGSIF